MLKLTKVETFIIVIYTLSTLINLCNLFTGISEIDLHIIFEVQCANNVFGMDHSASLSHPIVFILIFLTTLIIFHRHCFWEYPGKFKLVFFVICILFRIDVGLEIVWYVTQYVEYLHIVQNFLRSIMSWFLIWILWISHNLLW